MVRVEGFEPPFDIIAAPFTYSRLEGDLGYTRILFVTLIGLEPTLIGLGNQGIIQLYYRIVCDHGGIRTPICNSNYVY